MKLIKDKSGIYKYISDCGKVKITHSYLGIENQKYWILDGYNDKRKIFKTLRELKKYIDIK